MFKPGSNPSENEGQNKPQALIIDDEADICYLLKGILRQKNVNAAYAGSLAEGEEFLRHNHPAIIFLDNHLPDGFGIEHIRHFKEAYPSSKLVMITAHDTFMDREKAYSEGVDYFIGKPFTRDIIVKTLDRIGGV
ncbi:MAG: response regulator [Chitinophagaceae bacterium]|nr:MAG: response regulator [Chitinophagaceae bacterium]